MDRDEKDKMEDRKSGAGTAAATTRFTSPLTITSASRRKSLFSRSKPNDNATSRPSSAGSISDTNAPLSTNTKIPRLIQRHGFSLSDAYRLAEEEELGQGSPSPAPRMWRSRRGSAEQLRRQGSGAKPLVPRNSDGHIGGVVLSQQDDSDSTFDEKLRQFAKDQEEADNPSRRGNGFLSRSKLGTRLVETGKELLRKSSSNSLENPSPPRSAKAASESPSFLRRLSGRRRGTGDSPSTRASSDLTRSGDLGPQSDEFPHLNTTPRGEPVRILSDTQTPNRSFAWQADADFTGGDLQVSTSPPVAVRRSNTKIDQIRALEAELDRRSFETNDQEPKAGLDHKLHGLGSTAALTRDPDNAVSGTNATKPGEVSKVNGDRSFDGGTIGVDDPRPRTIDRLSRRVPSTSGLHESRENLGNSSSPQTNVGVTPGDEPAQTYSPLRDRLRRRDLEKESIADYRKETLDLPGTLAVKDVQHFDTIPPEVKMESKKDVPYLPATTDTDSAGQAPVTVDSVAASVRDREFGERTRQRRSFGGAKGDARPTVGFVGLSRSSSVDSKAGKPASAANSEADPMERIEGEMELFAPHENQSEKGSLRSPSPMSDGVPKETPKPIKVDPLTQPTPRVTGAYVDTPATVKVEKKPDGPGVDAMLVSEDAATSLKSSPGRSGVQQERNPEPPAPSVEKGGTTGHQQRRSRSSKGDRGSSRSSSISARRRARSLSRSRKPLINSAKPPTVKDDLLEIQRANNIDDSTLDDLADILDQHEQQAAALGLQGVKSEPSDDPKYDVDDTLELFDRMSRSLETGLLGIRSAKQGIERLEDKVAHAETKDKAHEKGKALGLKKDKEGPTPCHTCDDDITKPQMDAAGTPTYIGLTLPPLWYHQPKFRFTFFGLFLFLFTLWYIVESAVCFRYCRPDFCYPGTVCDWSADDPVWGYAIPVKLDQFVTGGQGRALAQRLQPEVKDWLADLWDAAMGTDPSAVDTSGFTWEQKRRHRRRLARKGLLKFPFEMDNGDDAAGSWTSASGRTTPGMGYVVDRDDDWP
ncbi:hypothetical protein VTJ49DRAFT_2700 [Mycothermus thermophilus]|uniref:Uncharacterized protein n=1 Tax=Humicola insolens TaxID=85995 RepID=A0ABR3V968_HUMIN